MQGSCGCSSIASSAGSLLRSIVRKPVAAGNCGMEWSVEFEVAMVLAAHDRSRGTTCAHGTISEAPSQLIC